ncbi:hypothetical protein B0H13DRAFT_1885182 [Mycena leptocephala]|nr:hypothetical protein B0H13DRAFT_1885182 [Mycena leptocephala]
MDRTIHARAGAGCACVLIWGIFPEFPCRVDARRDSLTAVETDQVGFSSRVMAGDTRRTRLEGIGSVMPVGSAEEVQAWCILFLFSHGIGWEEVMLGGSIAPSIALKRTLLSRRSLPPNKRSPNTFTGMGPTTTAPSGADVGAAAVANVRLRAAPCPAWFSCVRGKFLDQFAGGEAGVDVRARDGGGLCELCAQWRNGDGADADACVRFDSAAALHCEADQDGWGEKVCARRCIGEGHGMCEADGDRDVSAQGGRACGGRYSCIVPVEARVAEDARGGYVVLFRPPSLRSVCEVRIRDREHSDIAAHFLALEMPEVGRRWRTPSSSNVGKANWMNISLVGSRTITKSG